MSRIDHEIILEIIEPNSRVLDIGCADGALLALLNKKKNVNGQGIEIKHDNVEECLKNGLSVLEGDANNEITNFPKNSFDYVILSQTLQTVINPKLVLEQMLRVGKRVIVSFPNFGYWACRIQLLIKGKMPVTKELKYTWYNTPNIHLCTVKDFYELTKLINIHIEKEYAISPIGKTIQSNYLKLITNLISSHVIFLLAKNNTS